MMSVSTTVIGQLRPSFLPSQFQENEMADYSFTSPSKTIYRYVEFSYNIIGKGVFESEGNTIFSPPLTDITSRRESFVKLKVPIINQTGFKLIGELFHKIEQYKIKSVGAEHTETIQHLNNLKLRTTGFGVTMVKSVNSKSYFLGKFQQTFSGDMEHLFDMENKYAALQISGLYRYQFSDIIAVGIGLSYLDNFVDTQWLPIVTYSHQLSPEWGIEAVLPLSLYLKSYVDDKTVISIGAEYMGGIFNVSYENTTLGLQNYAFDQAALAGTVLIEKQLMPWVWFYSKIGFQSNFASNFIPLNTNTTKFEVDQTGTPLFKLSLFISPPDKNNR